MLVGQGEDYEEPTQDAQNRVIVSRTVFAEARVTKA